jgi:predicted acyltransferase
MPQTTTKPNRLLSLDALRGFDMFWITGGEEIFHLLAKATGWGWAVVMADQLTHVEWNGFRAYDLIFPTFLFMAGVSTPFSIGSQLAHNVSKSLLARKAIQRGLLLVLLGIVYNNGLQIRPLVEMRFASVLGRIGLAGMFASLIYIYFNIRSQYIWFVGILLGYWAFVMLVPVPDCGTGLMTMDCNPVSYLDKMILPGRLHKVIHDPEGLISTLPAICTGLLGIFCGNLLRTDDAAISRQRKSVLLVAIGLSCLAGGWLWDFVFPINKNLWTSSFVLFAGGWSVLALTAFYWVIDTLGYKRWAWVLAVIGMNSILIYLAQHFIDFEHTSHALFGGVFKYFPTSTQSVLEAIGLVVVEWLFLWFLYKKKVFLKT